jgi:hypothetical protein
MSKENIKTYMDSPQEDVGKNPLGDKKLQKKNKYFIGHHILLILTKQVRNILCGMKMSRAGRRDCRWSVNIIWPE